MDFIREINAFEQWLRTNYLPPFSQLLWYKLFMLCNSAGWPEWFAVENLDLMGLIKLKNEKSFIEYRDKLLEAGLIDYIKGKKGSPNRYKLNSLLKCTYNSTAQTTAQTTTNPTDYYKHKQDENENDNNNPLNPPDDVSKDVRAIIDYLNQRCGANYKPTSKTTKRHINARLRECFKLDDFIEVINKKAFEWQNRPEMVQYLRPQTLFGIKFEGYLNQPWTDGRKRSDTDIAIANVLRRANEIQHPALDMLSETANEGGLPF